MDLAITADNRAEGDESFTVNLSAAAATITPLSATPASWTVGTPSSVTFTIRRNDANNRYDPPPVVTPAPTTDNPAARSARVEVPAAAIARGLGQLAAAQFPPMASATVSNTTVTRTPGTSASTGGGAAASSASASASAAATWTSAPPTIWTPRSPACIRIGRANSATNASG